ncbi:hypothetical protein MTO96_038978 [Rhipicephalus appendiculatus]
MPAGHDRRFEGPMVVPSSSVAQVHAPHGNSRARIEKQLPPPSIESGQASAVRREEELLRSLWRQVDDVGVVILINFVMIDVVLLLHLLVNLATGMVLVVVLGFTVFILLGIVQLGFMLVLLSCYRPRPQT